MLAAVVLLVAFGQAPPANDIPRGALHLAGRTLSDAIDTIAARGLHVRYAPDVVRPDMRVATEPHGTTLRGALDEILQPHGLTTRTDPDGSLTVVKTPRFNENVEVAAEARRPAGPPPLDVPAAQAHATAGGAENVFHTLQLLPGVTPVSEFSSRQSIRGGGPDENLIVMDGIELLNPYRLFGVVSGINPDLVERFQLYAGAFPARYGDRLSSLLSIDTRDGSAARPVAVTGDVSITDANVVAEGRLPGGQAGSWLVTARRTYYDLIAGRLSTDIKHFPAFTDTQTKVVWQPSPPWRVVFHALVSHERADITPDSSSTGSSSDFDGSVAAATRTTLVAMTAERAIGERAHYRGTFAVSRLEDTFDLEAGDCFDALVSNTPNGHPCDRAPRVNHAVHVSDVATRQEMTWRASPRQMIDAGAEFHRESSRLTLDSQSADFPAFSFPGFGMFAVGQAPWHVGPQPLDSGVNESRAGAWIKEALQIGGALSIVPGARIDRLASTNETLASPRLSASLKATPRTTITAAAGVHYQSPGYDKAFLGGAAFGLDLSAPGVRLRSERAIQTVVGIERDLGGGVSARVEAYHRTLDRLIVGRLETEQERAARLASYSASWRDLQADIPSEPLITNVPSNDGSGRAAGVEALVTKRPTAGGRFSGWLSYTLSTASRTAYGITYPFDFDRRHALAIAGDYNLSPRLTLATSMQAASGLPVTLPAGARVAGETFFRPDGRPIVAPFQVGTMLPDRTPVYAYELDYGPITRINSARLPPLVRVDARFTLHPATSSGHWSFYADVINLLDRRNREAVFSDLVFNPSGVRPLVRNSYSGGFPLVPTFGIRARF